MKKSFKRKRLPILAGILALTVAGIAIAGQGRSIFGSNTDRSSSQGGAGSSSPKMAATNSATGSGRMDGYRFPGAAAFGQVHALNDASRIYYSSKSANLPYSYPPSAALNESNKAVHSPFSGEQNSYFGSSTRWGITGGSGGAISNGGPSWVITSNPSLGGSFGGNFGGGLGGGLTGNPGAGAGGGPGWILTRGLGTSGGASGGTGFILTGGPGQNSADGLGVDTNGLLFETFGFQIGPSTLLPDFTNNPTHSTAPVPEPSEWVLMLCGLGLMGFIARLKNR